MDTGSAQIPVDIIRKNNKATTSTVEPPESPTFAHYPEPGFYDDEKVTKALPNVQKTKDQPDPKRRSSRRPFQPHFQTGDLLTKEGDSSQSGLSTTTCHDIIQSKWLYDTHDPDREKVFLTSKIDSDFTDFHNSFRWIHHQRDVAPVSLSEFENAISTMTGLYEDEMTVATKCLREARSARKMSALGRYFDQTIYKARTVLQNAGDSTPVQATFVSIPVFALLHDWKVVLFIAIHALAQCFVNQDDQHTEVFRKLWGIVYDICALPGKSEKSLVYPNRHEVQYIRLASSHIRATAESCRHMLEDVWQDTDADPATWEPVFPQQLELAFQSIIVYLLVVRHATTSYGFEIPDIETAGNQIVNFFQEADYELTGMRVLRDTPNRPVTAESIRTAETLLGLLLENAFELCNAEPSDQGQLPTSSSPHFNLRHVYSKYTSSCIIRAKREATARVYKDIKLLLEEIDTVKFILKQQRKLFLDVTKKRESAKQLLDIRLNRRTLTQFEDMIEHFEKLHGLTKQAEFWARHSIEVRGEQNGKFIYVFTAVTVIFLPLSFVAGLLGMNTSDIRKMNDGQWLFWVVAIPFTIGVLIICLMIANVRLKRRINAIMRWLVRCCGRRLRGLQCMVVYLNAILLCVCRDWMLRQRSCY